MASRPACDRLTRRGVLGGAPPAVAAGLAALIPGAAGLIHGAAPAEPAVPATPPPPDDPVSPNQVDGATDSERIEAAIALALRTGVNAVVIPRMNRRTGKPIWLIERAILLPSDFTLELRDCLVRLAPGTKDNLVANAGSRATPPAGNRNVRVIGRGNAVLSGGLESPWPRPGDRNGWRTIGILLCGTAHFVLDGFRMEETHTWAISMEHGCAHGRVSNIDFANTNKYPNQDGVDVRKGCHDLLIENITGVTGDDAVALTGLRNEKWAPTPERPESMQIGGNRPTADDDIYNITIRNVRVKVAGGHHIVRLLNQDGIKLYNVFIRDVLDASGPADKRCQAAVKIGDMRYFSMAKNQLGETFNVFVDNVLSRAASVVKVQGTLKNSTLRNIVGYGGNTKLVEAAPGATENVVIDAHQF